MKYFITTVIVIVTIVIGVGLYVIGSPAKERMRRLDESRVQSLQMIQNQVVEYWRAKEKLPAQLSELNDPLRYFSVPKDPETGADYKYEIVNDKSFRLCAIFANATEAAARASSNESFKTPYPAGDMNGPFVDNQTWFSHDSGEDCFDRTIDPDYFKPPQILKD